MFGLVVLAVLGSLVWVWGARAQGLAVPPGGVALAAASLLALVAVLVKMWRHPGGIKDWVQGGVVDVTASPAGRLTWIDWAIGVTRLGRVDPTAGYLRLERRLLFGLVPVGTVMRPLRDFYRVEVQTEPRHTQRRRSRRNRPGLFAGPMAGRQADDRLLVGYTYSVFLVDRSGDRLCVLDLAAGVGQAEEAFIARLRQRLEDVVGRPGQAPASPSAQDEAAPPADGFDAWRKAKETGPGAGG